MIVPMYFTAQLPTDPVKAAHQVFSSVPADNLAYEQLARHAMTGLEAQYRRILSGAIFVRGNADCLDLYLRFFNAASTTGNEMLATSLVSPHSVWTDPIRGANWDFMRHGGGVRRLFIYGNDVERRDMLSEAKRQLAGSPRGRLHAFLCDRTQLPPGEPVGDFVLNTADAIAIEFSLDRAGDVSRGDLSRDANRISGLRTSFARFINDNNRACHEVTN